MSRLTKAENDRRTQLSPLSSANWLLQRGSAFGRRLQAKDNTILRGGEGRCRVEWWGHAEGAQHDARWILAAAHGNESANRARSKAETFVSAYKF
jgi:hypothetical protein